MSKHSNPVLIYCGGEGIYIDDSGLRRNKSLVAISGKPMVFYVMSHYLQAGFNRFILLAGYQKEVLEEYFEGSGHGLTQKCAQFQILDTGNATSTGDRLRMALPLIASEKTFCLTYSDTLSTVDLSDMSRFHREHGKVGTLLATRLIPRFRILGMRYGDPVVRGFAETSIINNDLINGGFYFFERQRLEEEYFPKTQNLVLEETVLNKLSAASELLAYHHEDWQCLESERDLIKLSSITNRILNESHD